MYARRVFNWWGKTFPQATFHYVNGGIGGTTSHYGVSRVVTDLLMYQPDFVVVDFSVNDEPEAFFQETYEGLIRKILSWDSKPALQAKLVLDGEADKAIILDGNFDEDWGDCLWFEPIVHHGEKKMHTVEITILEEEKSEINKKVSITENETPFYLLSVIGDFTN